MNKSLFIKNDIRKVLKLRKNDGKFVSFKIYNYTEESKKEVFNMYQNKMDRDMDSFDLTTKELQIMFDLFTDYRFGIDELSEMLDSPSIAFEQIFHEIELILGDMVVLFIQEQEKKLSLTMIDEALTNLKIAMIDSVKDINNNEV